MSSQADKPAAGAIRVGIGGWTYEPWRGTFYPESLTQKRELEYASRQLTSIDINGTYYGRRSPRLSPNGAMRRLPDSFLPSRRRASP